MLCCFLPSQKKVLAIDELDESRSKRFGVVRAQPRTKRIAIPPTGFEAIKPLLKEIPADLKRDIFLSLKAELDPEVAAQEGELDVRLSDELGVLMGGRKYCQHSELTREVLIDFMKSKGDVSNVNVIEISIQTLSGCHFSVAIDSEHNQVTFLKRQIEKAEGTPACRQQLFKLSNSQNGEGQELASTNVISEKTEILMCRVPVSAATWAWDAASDLVVTQQLQISGPGNSVITKIASNADYSNCMVIDQVMTTGVHMISLEIVPTEDSHHGDCGVLLGVAKVTAPSTFNPVHGQYDESTDSHHQPGRRGWFMHNSGSLYGSDQLGFGAGSISAGCVVTMQLDMDHGTLRFFVDGERHGPGFARGVGGPVRWATSMYWEGGAMRIVPTPAALAEVLATPE